MSDPRYAPYGADDDPFLTHPAGAGQLRAAGYRPDYSQPMRRQLGGYDDVYADHGQYTSAEHLDGHLGGQYDDPRGQGHDDGYLDRYDQEFRGQTYSDPAAQAARFAHRPAESTAQLEYRAAFAAQPATARAEPAVTAAARGNFAPRHAAQALPSHHTEDPYIYADQGRGNVTQAAGAPAAANARMASFAAPPRVNQYNPPQHNSSQHISQQHRPPFGQMQPPQMAAPSAQYCHADYAPPPMQHGAYAASHQPEIAHLGAMPRLAGASQWAGAICTVAIIIGVALWGYELAMRDANGIPVVRAAAGPLRIAPEIPGGEISANQGLAVNAIPAAGAAPEASDQIILAPQTASLPPEDMGAGAGILEEGSFAQSAGAGTDAALAGASDILRGQPETFGGGAADLTALPDTLPEDMPLSDAEAVERALEAALAEGGEPIASSEIAPAISNDPVSMAPTDPIAPPTAELDPATITMGTPMVQLGAFDSDATARAEWANLQTRFTELMAGKALVVEPAKSGGRDFFRLRAHGFASADDTRRFCAAVLAENGSCFPVDQR